MDKELTPIGELIEHFQRISVGGQDLKVNTRYVLMMLYGKLPTERKFAEGLFDAGRNFEYQEQFGAVPNDYPDFSTLYKKYENDI